MAYQILLIMLMTVGVVEAAERFQAQGICNANGETDGLKCAKLNRSVQPGDVGVMMLGTHTEFVLGFMACLILIAGIGWIWCVVETYMTLKQE